MEHQGRLRRAARHPQAGISLVETAALISLTGVLVAAFIPTFTRHLRASKLSEAVDRLEDLYRGTAAYYAEERLVNGKLVRNCLPESVGPLPLEPSPEPQYVDFQAPETENAEIWRALSDSEPLMLRYSYQVRVANPGCGMRNDASVPAVVFRANGDLDGDGIFSEIERAAQVSSEPPYLLEAVPPLHIRQRVE